MTCCWKRLERTAMNCCLQSISKINGGVGVVVDGDSIHLWVEGRISRGGLTDSCPPNAMVGSFNEIYSSRYSFIVYVL